MEYGSAVHAGLGALDAMVLDAGLVNSQRWFGKTHTAREALEPWYVPMLRRDRDDRYPPLFRANLDLAAPLAMDLKGSYVSAVVQCAGVWVSGGRFGCSWKVLSLQRADPPPPKPRVGLGSVQGYAFRDEDE